MGNLSIRKMDEKYVLKNWVGFQIFKHTFIWKNLKTHWHILMFHPFESVSNPITIVLSSYFHILVFLKMYSNAYKNMQFFYIMQWSQRTSFYWSLE